MANGQMSSGLLVSVGGGQALRADAAAAWLAVVAEVRARYGITLRLTDSYRPYSVQVRIFNERYDPASSGGGPFGDVRWWGGVRYVRRRGASAAVPGTSNHGLGVAVDVTALSGFNGVTYAYVAAVAPAHGWNNWAGRRIAEPWHWEYVAADDTHASAPTPAVPATPTASLPPTEDDMRDAIDAQARTSLGRTLADSEADPRVLRVARSQSTLVAELDAIAGSLEAHRHAVDAAYQDALGRHVESDGVADSQWAGTGGDMGVLRARLIASLEGHRHAVDLTYLAAMHRHVESDAMADKQWAATGGNMTALRAALAAAYAAGAR